MKRTAITRRAGPLLGVWLVVLGMLAAVSPVIPVASALDPTPEPLPTATPALEASPDAGPTPSVDPLASAMPEPTPDPSADPSLEPTPEPTLEPSPSPTLEPTAPPVIGGVRVDHFWVDTETDQGALGTTGAQDQALSDMALSVVYRVRFRVVNDGESAEQIQPALLWSLESDQVGWQAVPEVNPVPDQPFYSASDKGRGYEVRTSTIGAADLRPVSGLGAEGSPTDGIASAGRNPAPALALPAHSFTDVEFSIRATDAASWLTGYVLRLSLGDVAPSAQLDARVTMQALPAQVITPGQRSGVEIDEPEPAYPLAQPQIGIRSAALLGPSLNGPLASGLTSPHAEYGITGDACAYCHRTHTAQGDPITRTTSSPIATLCFSCHDGSGTAANIEAQFANPAFPANDPATSSYYRHPATVPSTHTSDREDEFGGALDRHAECVDCHQPHRSDATRPVMEATGWTASGAIVGASGVSVVNGPANTAPAYTWNSTTGREYELCLKCHSGFTQLPAQDPAHPSRWALDKGIELNPANTSFHPVQAQGTNQTTKMGVNLAGTSPYKLWTFTTSSTIRCANCHGSSALSSPVVDGPIDTHASANRGILLRNYRDRVLRSANTLYSAADFAECYLCHTEPPMTDRSRTNRADSNFRYHGLHMSGIAGSGSGGTDIDVAGAGQGNSLCAECHFRIHGSSLAVNGQASNPRLVNFAPNVGPSPGQGFVFIVKTPGVELGTCTLMCHGKDHQGFRY